MILVKLIKDEYSGTEELFNRAVNFIHSNEDKFQIRNGKIPPIRLLRQETGGGLVDCKHICLLYWAGKLLNKKEIRTQKLKKIENVT